MAAAVPALSASEPSYRVRLVLYEGFAEAPRGVFVSLFPACEGRPPALSGAGAGDKGHFLRTSPGLKDALPLAAADLGARSGKLARVPVVCAANGKVSRLLLEVMPLVREGGLLLDAALTMDGREVFHAGVETRLGERVSLGSALPGGRRFLLSMTATTEPPPPPPSAFAPGAALRFPLLPAPHGGSGGAEGSLALRVRSGKASVVESAASPELVRAAVEAAASWGDAEAFVHFRTGK